MKRWPTTAKPTAARSLTCGTITTTTKLMSTTSNCRLCAYWAQEPDSNSIGSCRRYAPEPVPGNEGLAAWPKTFSTNWCGDFKRGTYALKGS